MSGAASFEDRDTVVCPSECRTSAHYKTLFALVSSAHSEESSGITMAVKRCILSSLLLLCATVVHCRIVSLPERGLLDFVNPNNTNAASIFGPAQISSIASKFPHKMMESGLQAAQQAASQGLATGQQALQSGAGVLGALFNAAINAATSFFNIFTSFIPRSSQQLSSSATQTQ